MCSFSAFPGTVEECLDPGLIVMVWEHVLELQVIKASSSQSWLVSVREQASFSEGKHPSGIMEQRKKQGEKQMY